MQITHQPVIPISVYRCYFQATTALNLPEFPGSAWRGAFGHALKRTVCVVRNTPCQQCLLKTACAYSYIFEPPPNTEKMRKYTAAPHPFVLRLNQAEQQNDFIYPLDLILFGHGQRYLPYMIHALESAGKDGIGGKRQTFTLNKIDSINLQGELNCIYQQGNLSPLPLAEIPPTPSMPEHIHIHFETPLRIKQEQKNLNDNGFNFGGFFNSLLRRISMMSYFHTDTPLDIDFADLSQRARTINFSAQNLKWYDWTRYSSRQQTEMQMGGVIGSVELAMHGLEDFWPYLWLGQWTHNGKGTSMGMGAYRIALTSLSNN